jgi:hypothetical protein
MANNLDLSEIDPSLQMAQTQASPAAPMATGRADFSEIDPSQAMSPEEKEGRGLFTPEGAAAALPSKGMIIGELARTGV